MSLLTWGLGIFIFILVLTFSISIHEFGHLVVAKLFKISVPKYFIGFGKTLWSKKYKGTEYGFKPILLGGFCQIEDDNQPEGSVERNMLSYIHPLKRIIVLIIGPIINIFIGSLVLFCLLLNVPVNQPSTTIQVVNSCSTSPDNCAADKAGIKPGDKILQVDDTPINNFSDLHNKLISSGSTIIVQRDGNNIPLTVYANDKHMIGITVASEAHKRNVSESLSTINNLFYTNIKSVIELPNNTITMIGNAIHHKPRSADSASSIVGVGRAYGDMVSSSSSSTDKVTEIILYSALLNIGLGLVNLLPMLPLDGGKAFIALIDWFKLGIARVRRKKFIPLDYKIVTILTSVCGAFLFILSFSLVILDIIYPISM